MSTLELVDTGDLFHVLSSCRAVSQSVHWGGSQGGGFKPPLFRAAQKKKHDTKMIKRQEKICQIAKFTSRWLGKLLIFRQFVLTPKVSLSSICVSF